jgi:hypothetical protein
MNFDMDSPCGFSRSRRTGAAVFDNLVARRRALADASLQEAPYRHGPRLLGGSTEVHARFAESTKAAQHVSDGGFVWRVPLENALSG